MPNYRRNEDKWPQGEGMNYNMIHSVEDISDESGEVTEPVTLAEMKDYLRLAGFDESGEFTFDDSLIESMITGARERMEIYTDCSLVQKRISAVITNLCGNISLPAGPVTGTVTAVDSEGEDIVQTDIKLIGTKFPDLKEPLQAEMTLTYDAGYASLPKGLKNAIMAEVAYRYENRGDEKEGTGVCKDAMILASPYKRGSAFG